MLVQSLSIWSVYSSCRRMLNLGEEQGPRDKNVRVKVRDRGWEKRLMSHFLSN